LVSRVVVGKQHAYSGKFWLEGRIEYEHAHGVMLP